MGEVAKLTPTGNPLSPQLSHPRNACSLPKETKMKWGSWTLAVSEPRLTTRMDVLGTGLVIGSMVIGSMG